MAEAGVYSAVLHYLKAVEATGATDADTVMEWMKANPTQDPIFGEGSIREDGRHMHDLFLMEVNAPDTAQYDGDYFTALATLPEIGRALVCTPATNAHIVCRLLLENTQNTRV